MWSIAFLQHQGSDSSLPPLPLELTPLFWQAPSQHYGPFLSSGCMQLLKETQAKWTISIHSMLYIRNCKWLTPIPATSLSFSSISCCLGFDSSEAYIVNIWGCKNFFLKVPVQPQSYHSCLQVIWLDILENFANFLFPLALLLFYKPSLHALVKIIHITLSFSYCIKFMSYMGLTLKSHTLSKATAWWWSFLRLWKTQFYSAQAAEHSNSTFLICSFSY